MSLVETDPSGCVSVTWNLCEAMVVLPSVALQCIAAAWWLRIFCLVAAGSLALFAAAFAKRSTVWLHHHSSSVNLLPSGLSSLFTSALDLCAGTHSSHGLLCSSLESWLLVICAQTRAFLSLESWMILCPRLAIFSSDWQSVTSLSLQGVVDVAMVRAHASAAAMEDTLAGGLPKAAARRSPDVAFTAMAAAPNLAPAGISASIMEASVNHVVL